jgi:hypothetical protein
MERERCEINPANPMTKTFLFITLIALVPHAGAQILLNNFNTHTIGFESYTGGGFQPDPGAGQLDSDAWASTGMSDGNLVFGGTRTTGDNARGSTASAVTTGGFYNFNNAAINGGAGSFGIQPGGSDWNPGTLTLRLQNQTGSAIGGMDVGYDLWVRNDQGRSSTFNFSFSLDDSAYTSVSSLDYTSGAAGDSLGFVQNSRSASLGDLNIPVDGYFYARWSSGDVGGTGSRDEFALTSLSFTPVPEPSEYALMSAAALVLFAVYRARVRSA